VFNQKDGSCSQRNVLFLSEARAASKYQKKFSNQLISSLNRGEKCFSQNGSCRISKIPENLTLAWRKAKSN
jgi:hypothetical protein